MISYRLSGVVVGLENMNDGRLEVFYVQSAELWA